MSALTHHAFMQIESLPPIIREIAELIGEPAALRLVDRYGGFTIAPSNRRAEIAQHIGTEAAQRLAFHFKSSVSVYIPKCQAAIRAERDASLVAHFDELTRAGMSARKAVAELAGQYLVGERRVWRILKK